jgi:signal transduction histidine kinase
MKHTRKRPNLSDFLVALLGWLVLYSGMFLVTAGVYVNGVAQPFFSTAVWVRLAWVVIPKAVASPILFWAGATVPRNIGLGATRWRPAFWASVGTLLAYVLLHSIEHGFYEVVIPLVIGDMLLLAGVLAAGFALGATQVAEARGRDLLHTQLAALRSQLQPHFLFNTLQAIGATARRDPDATVRMIALLGDMLRQTLRDRDGGLVSLREELSLLQPYLDLQQLRFGERLRVVIQVPEDLLGCMVPDLLLQPLVENALRHGIEAVPGAGEIVVRARTEGGLLVLQIFNSGPGPAQSVDDGVGLGTTRARLDGLYGAESSLKLEPAGMHGATVTVRLPLQASGGARAA